MKRGLNPKPSGESARARRSKDQLVHYAVLAVAVGISPLVFPLEAQAYLGLHIEWLDEPWVISPSTDGQGNYVAATDVVMDPAGNVPIIKASTWAEGQDSSATAEVRVSRQFRVVLGDAPAIPMRLQGDVSNGRLHIGNTPGILGGDDGTVRFRAIAGIQGTAIQYDRQWEYRNKDVDLTFDDTIAVDGTLAANQTHTVTGYAYALGDSDNGLSGAAYRADGILSLPEPVAITDHIADYYYDVEWQEDTWSWTTEGDATGIGALDIFTDVITSGFPSPWDTLLNEGIDAYLERGGAAERIEGYFQTVDGKSYVFARGRNGGHAWVNVTSERDFSLVPVDDALARLRFDGTLTGELSSSPNASSMSLAQVSVVGSGLDWTTGHSASDGQSTTIHEDILAFGMAQLNQVYTFEALLELDSQAVAPGSLAYADFLSSLQGELAVEAVPVPGSAVLAAIGIASAASILRKKTRPHKP